MKLVNSIVKPTPILPGVTWLFVTPEAASSMLAKNNYNRKLKPAHVIHLAEVITEGRFIINGDVIRVYDDGDIADGQHRLNAIVESGIGVWLLVVFGILKTACRTIDKGCRRANSDDLGIAGEVNTTTLASAIGHIYRWKNGILHYGNSQAPDSMECDEILRNNPGIRNAVSKTQFTKDILPVSIAAFVFYHAECAGVDPREFFIQVVDGCNLDKDMPSYLLRNRFISDRISKAKLPSCEKLALMIKALQFHIVGRRVKCLKWINNGSESFPLLCEYESRLRF